MATYVLRIKTRARQCLTIGARGEHELPAGSYLYVGSAKRNWQARVARHLRREKRLRWHIDYILAGVHTEVERFWLTMDAQECACAQTLLEQGLVEVIIARIGASDCRCKAHFLRCKGRSAMLDAALLTMGFVDRGMMIH